MGKSDSLKYSEWVAIASFLCLFASCIVVAKINAISSDSPIDSASLPETPLCPVSVQGAVLRPGIYELPLGAPLKRAIRKSRPSLFADLRSLDLEKRIDGPISLNIEALKEIEICVQKEDGEEIRLVVPAGTRVCDLKDNAGLAVLSCCSIFKSRRILKPNEVLIFWQKEKALP